MQTLFFAIALIPCLGSDSPPRTPRNQGTSSSWKDAIEKGFSDPSKSVEKTSPTPVRPPPRSLQASPVVQKQLFSLDMLSSEEGGVTVSVDPKHELKVDANNKQRAISKIAELKEEGIFVQEHHPKLLQFIKEHKNLIQRFFQDCEDQDLKKWLATQSVGRRRRARRHDENFLQELRMIADEIFGAELPNCHREVFSKFVDFNMRGPKSQGASYAGGIHKDKHDQAKSKGEGYILYSLWMPLTVATKGALAICSSPAFRNERCTLNQHTVEQVRGSNWVTTEGMQEGSYILFPADSFFHGVQKVQLVDQETAGSCFDGVQIQLADRYSIEFKAYVKLDQQQPYEKDLDSPIQRAKILAHNKRQYYRSIMARYYRSLYL